MAYVNLGQVIYPIGAIFASASPTSPSSMFGGTWSQITGDACLMAGTIVGNAGSKKITIAQMPSHNHPLTNNLGCGWEGNSAAGDKLGYSRYKNGRMLREFGDSSYQGGGKTTCLTPTDAICGGEQLNSSDTLCVTSKTSKSELVQALKQFIHSQLEQYTNLLIQPVQLVSMAEDGHLSQTVDSLDRKGLGIILAEKMSTNSLLRKCQAIDICQPIQEKLAILVAERDIQFLLLITMAVMQHILLGKVIAPRTTTFPHIEPAIVGIELPNILGGVLC